MDEKMNLLIFVSTTIDHISMKYLSNQKVDIFQQEKREKIINVAHQRSKQTHFNQSLIHSASHMKGQVGGVSDNKKRILSTESNLFLLKPLQNDNRGLREVAF